MTFSFTRSDFPENFLFGVATAAYQIEGSQFGGAGPSHWDTFAATPGNVANAETGAVACDHYHRWPEDLDLIKAGNFDAYRFSTSWSRVMPDGRTINPEGLDFYDRLVDGMAERGITPFLTLYHWDLPAPLADIGGWTNRDVAPMFADFAQAVIGRIGDRIDRTMTINEPWCVSFLSHFLGHHAPGLRDIRAAARSMHFVLLAHAEALEAMRAMGQPNLGIAPNFEFTQAASDSAEDRAAAARWDAIFNRWFVQALTKGTYPEEALEGLGPHLPEGWEDDMARISAPIDWMGVNYYTRSIMAADPDIAWPALKPVTGPLEKTDMGWEVYPDGFRHVLTRLARDYTGDTPLIVTENGMAGPGEDTPGPVTDSQRIAYYDAHLAALRQAIAEGAPVEGYCSWSLLDNYEWAFGYGKRFGLVQVDYETQTRTPKASFDAFKKALSTNR
ncbi:beta-glucosidase [Ponticoccus sp. SC2-23]|uniref:GH1 family beta-glucosidase n=1 Tax=Alexandriicola marinus TaxID=2081710 RepID=UPI000FD7A8CE|nr:GH1 family beta-glucosidase [Alexandriicola marinus]MBM1221078.1 beta-glucosidase [Ponticoccus sp. SC6-9]MBM1225648.1 beta-glucosidase [Ponticoccus sp. SC6-15]MBM1227800.1 beta-glucosidase [Ponticoccus sp. SC6-38]MBM1234562.1 beta-glucosidase [Ponticoccus sp. SC6-45]MBM1238302.1 beta-glucosidase [Ponticoccus sp. SC6-49]MBM1243571.1 beta-glucosidase [Ponticoccus sp. SC2-64]MBM1248086.1 beta-glucosidase [Ponticoccus sp. SC6-42]MBM1252702.1 beta-glucosidase [Ponticoccus sp. SC6-33]MBM12563